MHLKGADMGKVFIGIAMSLDGYIARPNMSKEYPFGVGGEEVYAWQFEKKTDTDAQIVDDLMEATGAVIAGGRTYKLSIDGGWHGVNPFRAPVFVLSQNVPDHVVEGFTFVTDGIESALRQAKAVAGNKDIWVMGGAHVAQQFLKAGLVDELHIHLASVLLGDGLRLFENIGGELIELKLEKVVPTPSATHLKYTVIK
jgi:dihydrofolate reductase